MQIAKTNYNKESSTTTQPSSSSKFLEAQLPPDEESSNLVDKILDVVAAVAAGEEGGDTKSEATPEFGRNLIELISQKQQEEDKSVMAKVKAELEETLHLVRQGREKERLNSTQSPVNAVASVASESALVPVPVSDSVKEVRQVIQRMEKAIASFSVSESDELPTSVINSPKTQTEKLLVDLQAARRRISISDLREPVKGEPNLIRAQAIIDSIESKLGRWPSGSSKGPDVLINPADEELIKPPRTYLKQIANRMGPAVPDSLVSSWISSSAPDENSSINDSEVIEGNSTQASQSTTPPISAIPNMARRLGVLAEELEIEPSLRAPSIPSSPLNSPPPPEPVAKLPIYSAPDDQAGPQTSPPPSSPEIIVFEPLSDPPSASKSPTRRANRRAGNYTLKGYSPIKTLPPRISTSPRMHSEPN